MRQLKNIRSTSPWRILFFGTDEFSLKILESLNENRLSHSKHKVVDCLHIVHPNVKNPSPVLRYAALSDLSGFEWPTNNIQTNAYDVGVLASFGHLIPKKVIDAFPYGIINVHPSLLPRWRGAAPLHHTVLNGDTTTGISIMSLKPKHFDSGPILKQKNLDVPFNSSVHGLRDFLAIEGGKLIIDVLSNLPECIISEKQQPENGVTYAHKLTLNMSFIDWENQTLDSIDRQYRAIHETTELRTEFNGLTIRLLEMLSPRYSPNIALDSDSPPGKPIFDRASNVLWVRCKDHWAGFMRVVIKKKMTAKEFYNGYLSKGHFSGALFTSKPNNLFNDIYNQWIKEKKPS
ncbi:methionyl-tRNA formyltransferase, mitochondrial [Biomphalaria glabrata]|nr:methionyl-tRNA formyltransferase, mitochondrial [Biomphalaria glabrata]